jgi:low temperature requirement protein LtrA
VNSGMLGLVCWAMWQHASHKGNLLDETADPRLIRMVSRLWLLNPIVFGVTIPLAYGNVYVTYVVWIMVPVISYMSIGRYLRRGGVGR